MSKIYWGLLIFILCLILYPLVIPWYIFSLDQAFPYYYTIPEIWANNYWLSWIGFWFTQLWIPTWILEKITYIIFLGSIGYFWNMLFSHLKNDIAKFFWILFLYVNPFIYARFIEWQINVYLSYAFFIGFIAYMISYFEYRNAKKNTLFSLIWLSFLLCLTSIHNTFIIALITCIFFLVYHKKNTLKNIQLIWGMLGINLLWIIPFLVTRRDLISTIENFWIKHQDAFVSSVGIYHNIYLNLLSLKWYWGEDQHRFIPSELLNQYYFFFFLIILFFIFLGWIYLIRNKKRLAISAILLCILAYILALGISQNNIFSGLNEFLFRSIPFYTGFREPHKWLMVVTILFTWFAAIGIDTLYIKIQSSKYDYTLQSFCLLILCLPLIYTPAMLFWAWGQLNPKTYPQEWEIIRNSISELPPVNQDCEAKQSWTSQACYNYIVFPWHGYISIQWTGKRIVISGILRYFWENWLLWDPIEIGEIYTQSSRPESAIIEKYIAPWWELRKENINEGVYLDFIHDLQSLWITSIILLKSSDYIWYEKQLDSMTRNNLLDIQQENSMITLYHIHMKEK